MISTRRSTTRQCPDARSRTSPIKANAADNAVPLPSNRRDGGSLARFVMHLVFAVLAVIAVVAGFIGIVGGGARDSVLGARGPAVIRRVEDLAEKTRPRTESRPAGRRTTAGTARMRSVGIPLSQS